MRTIISLIMSIAMMFSTVAFAADSAATDFQELLSKPFTCGNMNIELSTKLDAPLNKLLDPDGEISKTVDSFKATFDMDLNANAEGTIMQAAGTISIELYDEDLKFNIWLDLDARDIDNFKYKAIIKLPDDISEQYMVLDYTKLPGFGDILDILAKNGLFDSERTDEINSNLSDCFDTTNVTYKDGVFTLVFSEEEIKESIVEFFEVIHNVLVENIDFPEYVDTEYNFDEILAYINSAKLFDTDKAVEINAKTDKDGKTEISYKVNVDTNAFDFSTELPVLGVKKEFGAIKGSALLTMTLTPAENVNITFPEITAENSIDMMDEYALNSLLDIDKTKIIVLYNNNKVEFENDPIIKNDRTFVPIRKLANSFGISDENIEYNAEDETVTIKNDDIVIKLTIGSDKAFVGDKEIILDEAAFTFEDRTYLPLRFVSETFGKKVDYKQFTDDLGNETGGLIRITD